MDISKFSPKTVQKYWDWFTGTSITFITIGFFCILVYPHWWILIALVVYVAIGMGVGTYLNSKEIQSPAAKDHWYESTLTEPFHKR